MSDKVTYTAIVEALAEKTDFSKNKSEAFIKGLIGIIKKELDENGEAVITNFGRFSVKEVAEREGQNPQTGEPMIIPAHKRVTFTPYKPLREKVNAPYAHLETELVEEEPQKASEPVKAHHGTEEESSPSFFSSYMNGRQSGIIIAGLLMLVLIAIASAWFLLDTNESELASEQAAVEQAQTPEAGENLVNENSEPEQEEKPSDSASEELENPEREIVNGETKSGQSPKEGRTYKVQINDWYWIISEKVYGESALWPLLFQANQTVRDDPDQLYPSTGLEIPELDGTVSRLSREDYLRLADAAAMVSEAYEKAGKQDKANEYARFAKKWERSASQ